jgi:uncharacterized HAD superfamily protein
MCACTVCDLNAFKLSFILMHMHIGLDLDEVLAGFIDQFVVYYNQRFGTKLRKTDFTEYEMSHTLGRGMEETTEIVYDFYDSLYFLGIPPVYGAINGVARLHDSHQVSVVTGRPAALEMKTRIWLEERFLNGFQHIVFGNHYAREGISIEKSELCRSLSINLLVEDSPAYATECATAGIPVLLMDRPWNRNGPLPSNVTRVYDWEDVLDYFTGTTEA